MKRANRIGILLFAFLAVASMLCLPGVAGPSPQLESSVLSKVMQIHRQKGHINFSELYNSQEFSTEERAYLGRLYEVFFAIPGFLLAEQKSTGQIPSRAEIARSFDIGERSVTLLLSVMEQDSRVPRMFTRDKTSGEIKTIDSATIEAFVKARGSNVRMTNWEGQPLPEFSLATIVGGKLSSEELKGSPAVLYFWFTGCPPCVRLAPILAELSRKYGPQGLRFVGLNADDVLGIGTDDASRRAYVAKEGLTFPIVKLDATTRQSFGQVNVFPTLFFVDRNGVIRHHLVNFQSEDTLESIIQAML